MNLSFQVDGAGAHDLQVLWEDGESAFCRRLSHADADQPTMLVVVPVAEHPSPASLERLAHEFALKDELDPVWAPGQGCQISQDVFAMTQPHLLGRWHRWTPDC